MEELQSFQAAARENGLSLPLTNPRTTLSCGISSCGSSTAPSTHVLDTVTKA